MKVRLLYGLFLLLILAACKENNLLHPKPSDILSSDQMIPLLVDIHLADASVKITQPVQQAEIKYYYSTVFAPVFKKHNTTPAVFEKSMKWYDRHLDKLSEIYTEVITRLSTLESVTRIRVRPNRPGGYNPLVPDVNTDTTYLRVPGQVIRIPYILPAREHEKTSLLH